MADKEQDNGKVKALIGEIVDTLPELEPKDALEELIEVRFDEPIKPEKEYLDSVRDKKSRDYNYYLYIAPEIPEWWQEFVMALDDENKPKYKNAFQFARAKAKDKRQQELIYEMIGPRPDMSKLRVPWLGDWKLRRISGYCTPYMPSNVKKLAEVCKNKLESMQAIRAAAPYLVKEMGLYDKLAEQVLESFNGRMFTDKGAPDSPSNFARAKAMFNLLRAITRMKQDLVHDYWAAFGMNRDKPEMMMQINQQINIGDKTEMAKMTVEDMEAWNLGQMLKAHADNFNLPMEDEVVMKKTPPTIEAEPVDSKEVEANGRSKPN